MGPLDQIFSYYDKTVAAFSPAAQAIIALIFLAVLIWQIFMIVKSGHWIFIALFVILLPGTWPAARQIGLFLYTIIKFLFIRAQLLLY